jgi:Fe-S-cluster-containing hydrogenase component 2
VIECTQNIPCNPCQDACPRGCIRVGEDIVALPAFDEARGCTGCGLCVAACSGQCVFLVDEGEGDGPASVTFPYEFLPLPRAGEEGVALDRAGRPLCRARVTGVKAAPAFDRTALVTIEVPSHMCMRARFWARGAEVVPALGAAAGATGLAGAGGKEQEEVARAWA